MPFGAPSTIIRHRRGNGAKDAARSVRFSSFRSYGDARPQASPQPAPCPNGSGQYLASDEIPKFHPLGPDIPQGQYAVKIVVDDPDPSKFQTGAQASAAIRMGETEAWAALREFSIRAHSWFNWLYPMPF
jgi:hypothetical protein